MYISIPWKAKIKIHAPSKGTDLKIPSVNKHCTKKTASVFIILSEIKMGRGLAVPSFEGPETIFLLKRKEKRRP